MNQQRLKPGSRIAQVLQDSALASTSTGFAGRAFRYLLRRLRGVLLRAYDPAVVYDLRGSKLLLPYSHQLPYILQFLPEYTLNVARVARRVREKYPAMSIIDIGANVGDTLAIIRSAVDSSVLCIEGEDRFFALLRRNAQSFSNVELAHAFVGHGQMASAFAVSSGSGTAHLAATSSNDGVTMRTLDEILAEHPRFATTLGLIKVDTDGFDVPILLGALDLLRARQPVIFFEYSPFHLDQLHLDGLPLFDALRGAGYQRALVWENGGDFLLGADLEDKTVFQDLHFFYSGRRGAKYCDIAVFAERDLDICEATRAGEIELFRNLRGTP